MKIFFVNIKKSSTFANYLKKNFLIEVNIKKYSKNAK